MTNLLSIFFTIVLIMSITESITYGVQSRSIESRLDSGNVRITIDGFEEIVTLNGPVDFTHDGRQLKADAGILKLVRDDASDERMPLNLELRGSIRYRDDQNYTAKANRIVFNFETGVLDLFSDITVTGNEMSIIADRISYDKHKNLFLADKGINHKGVTRRFPLLREISSSDENVDYTVDCVKIEVNNQTGTVNAEGNVVFKIESTLITCDKVNLVFVDNEITGIHCEGNVDFSDPDMKGTADTVDYIKADKTLTLKSSSQDGVVKVVYKGNRVEGSKAVLTLVNGRELTVDKGRFEVLPDR